MLLNVYYFRYVKIPLSRVIVLSLLFFNFKTMVTWWVCPTSFTIVFHVSRFIFILIHSWILSRSQKSPIRHAGIHYLLSFYPLFLLSILVNPLLTSPVYCTQDLLIPIYPIHDFRECVTVIFSLVTSDDVIRDSCLIDTLPSIIHEFQSSPSVILLICLKKSASGVFLVMMSVGFSSLRI